jgi:hypothetical protein
MVCGSYQNGVEFLDQFHGTRGPPDKSCSVAYEKAATTGRSASTAPIRNVAQKDFPAVIEVRVNIKSLTDSLLW